MVKKKSMRFGISTWFFQEYTVVDALKEISESGFQAAEVWMHATDLTTSHDGRLAASLVAEWTDAAL